MNGKHVRTTEGQENLQTMNLKGETTLETTQNYLSAVNIDLPNEDKHKSDSEWCEFCTLFTEVSKPNMNQLTTPLFIVLSSLLLHTQQMKISWSGT